MMAVQNIEIDQEISQFRQSQLGTTGRGSGLDEPLESLPSETLPNLSLINAAKLKLDL
jgi:hypothetical protein